MLRLSVEHREEERELVAGLLAGRAEVGALEDPPEPQHGSYTEPEYGSSISTSNRTTERGV